MLDMLIKGGQVVTPSGVGNWDVGVEGERIVAVALPGVLPEEGATVIDATGKIVVPAGWRPTPMPPPTCSPAPARRCRAPQRWPGSSLTGCNLGAEPPPWWTSRPYPAKETWPRVSTAL